MRVYQCEDVIERIKINIKEQSRRLAEQEQQARSEEEEPRSGKVTLMVSNEGRGTLAWLRIKRANLKKQLTRVVDKSVEWRETDHEVMHCR